MPRFFLSLLLIMSASVTQAQVTPEQVRAFAYAGDVAGVEAAFVQAHQESLDGTISYEGTRDITRVMTVTHPDIRALTEDWLEQYPQSPYAKTVRSFQLSESAWGVRGQDAASDTHPFALEYFRNLHETAMDMALAAYQVAPDFIPASDAVLSHQLETRRLSRLALFKVLKETMDVTPSYGTLTRALSTESPRWGGAGRTAVVLLCSLFSEKVTDVPEFSRDICIAARTYALDQSISAQLKVANALIDLPPHPTTRFAHAMIASRRAGPGDRDFVLDYLANVEFKSEDILNPSNVVRRRFVHNFVPDAESDEILRSYIQRAGAYIEENLPHDPLNWTMLEAFQPGIAMNYDKLSAEERQHRFRIAMRKAMASPYNTDFWRYLVHESRGLDGSDFNFDHDPFYINAIVASDFSTYDLGEFMTQKITAYEIYGPRRGVQDFEAQPQSAEATQILCTMKRLERLISHQCELRDESCERYNRYGSGLSNPMKVVAAQNLCAFESNAPIEELYYGWAEFDQSDMFTGIANR